MTTPTSNIVKHGTHNIHNNVRSAALPHVDCYSRLRASPRVFSELGYRPTRCRDAHQAVSLPQKGWVGLPAYRQAYTFHFVVWPTMSCFADWSRERDREKFIDHKQINDVTIKIINLCGRLPARKFPFSWQHMLVQLSLIHIWRCRRSTLCRSRWSPYH